VSEQRLINLLVEEFGISERIIQMTMRRCTQVTTLLPIALWNSGLLTLEQLDEIWKWIEASELY
jgi:hypothetical protein